MVKQTLTRPYPVTISMVLLACLVPCYIFIAQFMPGRRLHAPELAFDRAVRLRPSQDSAFAPWEATMTPVSPMRFTVE